MTATSKPTDIAVTELPFETEQLRIELARFLNQAFELKAGPGGAPSIRLGSIKWGVYAFFDFDNEPIYVGQTKEKLSTRIRRHLTNQRTDAVAMNVLDPFEVHTIEVWPLADFEHRLASDKNAVAHLNALEHAVYHLLLGKSEFNVVLNEKDPPAPTVAVALPASIRGTIVSAEVSRLRDHPDLRIARRASTLAKLAQVISERKVQKGLRRTLLAQTQRLQSLAQKRFAQMSQVAEDDSTEE
jgi:hypothetical protein